MRKVKNIFGLHAVERFFNLIASFLLIGMMLLIVTDVAGRYIFRQVIQGTTEITEFALLSMVYLSLSYTQAVKSHINVDLILEFISQKARHILALLNYGVGTVMFALIGWQGVIVAKEAWEYSETTAGLIPFPKLPARTILLIGCFLFSLRFLVDFIATLRQLKGNDSR